jgi:hypothetical protein
MLAGFTGGCSAVMSGAIIVGMAKVQDSVMTRENRHWWNHAVTNHLYRDPRSSRTQATFTESCRWNACSVSTTAVLV